MSSIPLYKAFIEVGASEDSAANAAEDVIQVSRLEQLATKADLMATKSGLMAKIDLMATKSELMAKIDLMATKSELAATKSELMSNIDLMATKSELAATKSELMTKIGLMATKSELAATKSELMAKIDLMATKSELAATRADIGRLETNMAKQESRLIKWMVGSLFVFATIIIASGGILFQIMLSSGVAP